MSNASRDANRIPTWLGTLSTDGTTPVPVKVTSATHSLNVSNGIGGTDLSGQSAVRDSNRVTTIWGVSSVDGVTPVAIYCDSNGNLLVKST